MNSNGISFLEIGENFDPLHQQGFIKVYQQAFAGPPYHETYTDEDVINDVWKPHLQDGSIILALKEGQVIGLGCAMPMDKWAHDEEFQNFIKQNLDKLPDDPSEICFMTEVAVLPGHQNNGIGTSLIKQRFDWAKRQGFQHYMMRTAKVGSNSIRMYQNLGGQIMEDLIQDVSHHAEKVQSQSTERVYIKGTVD